MKWPLSKVYYASWIYCHDDETHPSMLMWIISWLMARNSLEQATYSGPISVGEKHQKWYGVTHLASPVVAKATWQRNIFHLGWGDLKLLKLMQFLWRLWLGRSLTECCVFMKKKIIIRLWKAYFKQSRMWMTSHRGIITFFVHLWYGVCKSYSRYTFQILHIKL